MKQRNNNAKTQTAGQRLVQRIRVLIDMACAARGGVGQMTLNDWRDAEQEIAQCKPNNCQEMVSILAGRLPSFDTTMPRIQPDAALTVVANARIAAREPNGPWKPKQTCCQKLACRSQIHPPLTPKFGFSGRSISQAWHKVAGPCVKRLHLATYAFACQVAQTVRKAC